MNSLEEERTKLLDRIQLLEAQLRDEHQQVKDEQAALKQKIIMLRVLELERQKLRRLNQLIDTDSQSL